MPQIHPNKKHRTIKLLYRIMETVKMIGCEKLIWLRPVKDICPLMHTLRCEIHGFPIAPTALLYTGTYILFSVSGFLTVRDL